MKIENEVTCLLARMLGLHTEEIGLESEIKDDLGADSLDYVEIIIALEEIYNIGISESDAEKIITVQNLIDFIKQEV